MRKHALPLLAIALLAAIVGCASDFGPVLVGKEDVPTHDTGPVRSGTTGGDAAGTFNIQRPKEHKPAMKDAGH